MKSILGPDIDCTVHKIWILSRKIKSFSISRLNNGSVVVVDDDGWHTEPIINSSKNVVNNHVGLVGKQITC